MPNSTETAPPPRKISVTVIIEESSTLLEKIPTLEPKEAPTLEPSSAPSSNGFWVKFNTFLRGLIIGYGVEGLRRLFLWLYWLVVRPGG
jgi:hypothetical protein